VASSRPKRGRQSHRSFRDTSQVLLITDRDCGVGDHDPDSRVHSRSQDWRALLDMKYVVMMTKPSRRSCGYQWPRPHFSQRSSCRHHHSGQTSSQYKQIRVRPSASIGKLEEVIVLLTTDPPVINTMPAHHYSSCPPTSGAPSASALPPSKPAEKCHERRFSISASANRILKSTNSWRHHSHQRCFRGWCCRRSCRSNSPSRYSRSSAVDTIYFGLSRRILPPDYCSTLSSGLLQDSLTKTPLGPSASPRPSSAISLLHRRTSRYRTSLARFALTAAFFALHQASWSWYKNFAR